MNLNEIISKIPPPKNPARTLETAGKIAAKVFPVLDANKDKIVNIKDLGVALQPLGAKLLEGLRKLF